MTASLRRSLADPFSLGDQPVAWELPAALPERTTLRGGIAELERSLKAATPSHMQWCVGKLFVLPTRAGDATKAAMQTDNFIDACGHFPDDLWTAGTLELLQTKTFRPSPAELFELINGRFTERQRMLQRAQLMLNGGIAPVEAEVEKPIPTRLGRLQHTRAIYARLNRTVDVDRMDREIAKELGEPVPSIAAEERDMPERPPFVPDTSPAGRRCAELATAHHTGKPAPEYRDVPEDSHAA